MKYRIQTLAPLVLVLIAGTAEGQALSLLKTLGGLGVSPAQALGGTQALMNVAKGNLGADEFSQLLGAAPELGQIMQMTDAGGALGGMMGGSSSAGAGDAASAGALAAAGVDVGDLSSLMNNASLVSQFTDLGMSADMIGNFAPHLLGLAGQSGPDALGLLRKGLGIL